MNHTNGLVFFAAYVAYTFPVMMNCSLPVECDDSSCFKGFNAIA